MKHAPRDNGRVHWLLSAAVLLLGLVVTAWFLHNDRLRERDYVRASFNAAAERIAINISNRLQTLRGAMRGIQGFFTVTPEVSPEEFRRYVEALQLPINLPGVQAVGFARLVTAAELDAHVQRQRALLDPQFTVTPPGARARYAPITYMEPLQDNRSALGYDILDNPEARAATELTLQRNDIVITSSTTLIQDEGRDDIDAFIMYLPVYRSGAALDTPEGRAEAILGWVDVPFRMNDLMESMRGQFNPDIYLEIHDGEPDAGSLVYRSTHPSGQDRLDTTFDLARRDIEVGGRQWTLLINSTPTYVGTITTGAAPVLIAANGVLLSLLLSLVVWLTVKARYSAEHRFARVFDNAGEGVVLFDRSYRILDANALALKLFGYSKAELRLTSLPELVGLDAPALDAELAQAVPGSRWLADWECKTRSGGSFPAQVSIGAVNDEQAFAVLRDMTQRRKHEQRILRLTQLYKALSATSHLILHRRNVDELLQGLCHIAVDYGGMATAWVGQVEAGGTRIQPVAVAGLEPDKLARLGISSRGDVPEGLGPTGTALRENRTVIVEDFHSDAEPRPWHALALEHGWRAAGSFPIRRGGRAHVVLTVYHAQTDAFDAEAIELLEEMAQDISFALDNYDLETGHKVKDERIAFLSNYDVLTMLPNRELLRDRARMALATAQKAHGHVALLSIDLDRFKIVNESLGPSAGDELLLEFSRRLSALVQPQYTLCRQGGDEFLLLMPGTSADGAAHMAHRILAEVTKPFMLRDQRMVVTACLGIALYPEDAHDFEQLVRSADAAMFRAKKAGGGNMQFFTRQMHEYVTEVLTVESELRQAIELDQLRLHYQPQVDLTTRRITGAEALLRWQHPERGLLFPGSFIPIAEESGLIVELGTWVLRAALRQCREWEQAGLGPVPVAVNLSPIQFRQPNFYDTIVGALEEAGLAPHLLELEFTEGIAMENSHYTIDLLTRLHELGVSLSVDDFGMGYSALGYLKRYPLHTLKIDQSFVRGLGQQTGDEAIVNSIIVLAQSLGFRTLAEGVETAAQLAYLEKHGCSEVQGFLFSKAVPAAAFAELLRKLQPFTPFATEDA